VASQAPDIRLVQNLTFPKYSVTLDWNLLNDGTLDDRYALATAVCIALGTNALADRDDILPDPDSTDRQGWWGNIDAQEIWGGWDIGSKLWLLRRSKIEDVNAQRGSTLTRVINYISLAIQPFVDARICTNFLVEATRNDPQQIDALIRMFRGPLPEIELRYSILWEGIKP
jgi:phage gp46-like protein